MVFFDRIKRFAILFWQMARVMMQLLYGAWRISKLKGPIVTIFGGARLVPNTPYGKKAYELSQKFMNKNISILTGGGPGIMEAASCGARSRKSKSIGIGVASLGEERNHCVGEYFELDYFFARKWLLTQYSSGFIIFPGGFGTLDELFETLTMIQTKNLTRVPIVLIGVEFWKGLADWITNEPLAHGLVAKEHLEFFKLTDDLQEAYCWIMGKCEINEDFP